MRVLHAVLLQICFFYCITCPLVSGEDEKAQEPAVETVPNALRAKPRVGDDLQQLDKRPDSPARPTSLNLPPTESDESESEANAAYEAQRRLDVKNRNYELRLQAAITHLLPDAEVQLLKYFNELLQELILEQKEICDGIALSGILPSPFFDCSIFGKPAQTLQLSPRRTQPEFVPRRVNPTLVPRNRLSRNNEKIEGGENPIRKLILTGRRGISQAKPRANEEKEHLAGED